MDMQSTSTLLLRTYIVIIPTHWSFRIKEMVFREFILYAVDLYYIIMCNHIDILISSAYANRYNGAFCNTIRMTTKLFSPFCYCILLIWQNEHGSI